MKTLALPFHGGVRTLLNIQDKDFCTRYLFSQKNPSQKSDQVPNTYCEIVVRKFPRCKLKQRKTKKVKN